PRRLRLRPRPYRGRRRRRGLLAQFALEFLEEALLPRSGRPRRRHLAGDLLDVLGRGLGLRRNVRIRLVVRGELVLVLLAVEHVSVVVERGGHTVDVEVDSAIRVREHITSRIIAAEPPAPDLFELGRRWLLCEAVNEHGGIALPGWHHHLP